MKAAAVLQMAVNVAVITAVVIFVAGHRKADKGPREPLPSENMSLTESEWQRLIQGGSILGHADAAIVAVEFVDYECVYCAQVHRQVARYLSIGETAIAVRHYPLPHHKVAEGGARAAVCAEDQGRFQAMHELLFSHEEWKDAEDWMRLASSAQVPDLSRFEACLTSESTIGRLRADRELVDEFEIRGTPTFITRNHKYIGAIDRRSWAKAIGAK